MCTRFDEAGKVFSQFGGYVCETHVQKALRSMISLRWGGAEGRYKMGTSFSNTIRAADAAAKSRSKASSSRASSSSSSVRTSTHRKTQPSATSSRARHHEPAAAAASGAGDPKPAFARKCYSSSPSPAKVDQLVSQFG